MFNKQHSRYVGFKARFTSTDRCCLVFLYVMIVMLLYAMFCLHLHVVTSGLCDWIMLRLWLGFVADD